MKAKMMDGRETELPQATLDNTQDASQEGEKAVAAIKSFGSPIGDVLVRRPYAQLQALLDGPWPKGRRYYWKSEYLPRVETQLCEKFLAHSVKIRSPHSAMVLFQIDGGPEPAR